MPVDALIVGGGPAGLSAALSFARQNQTSIVFDNNKYRNHAADYIHLIPGLDHVNPSRFRQLAKKQLIGYYNNEITLMEDVNLVTAKKTESEQFELQSDSGKTWTGKKMILATGVEDVLPDIPGYADCWGKSIFHCLYCKGFEQRGNSAGILAFGSLGGVSTALHVARQASALSNGVTLYTNGNQALAQELDQVMGTSNQMKTDARKVKNVFLGPNGAGVIVCFNDDSEVFEDYLAHQPQTRPRGLLVDQLGLEKSPSGDIKVSSPFQQTSVRGIFAAGDNCGLLKNVPNAIFSGHVAALMASTQLLAEMQGQKPLFPL